MNPQMMASGGGQPNPQIQISPGQVTSGDPQKIIEVIKAVVRQSVDQNGFVDIDKVIQLWPQISQQMGINIPFQSVMQMIQQDPDILDNIITQMGLAGLTQNGRRYSLEQLLGQASGASGIPSQGQPPPGMGG